MSGVGKNRNRIVPMLAYQADPIRESLKVLGRKWTLLVLRDIAFLKLDRFGPILRNNPGLTPRVLSRRLKQMQREGLMNRVSRGDRVHYELTKRGEDAIFILLAFLRYGLRHHLDRQPHGSMARKRESGETDSFDQLIRRIMDRKLSVSDSMFRVDRQPGTRLARKEQSDVTRDNHEADY